MTAKSTSALKIMAATFLVISGLYFARFFFIPLVVAGVLATLFLPLCKKIELRGIPKGVAVIFCSLILLLVIAFIIALLSWQIFELTQGTDLVKVRILEMIQRVREYLSLNLGISFEKQNEVLNNQQPFIGGALQQLAGSFTFVLTQLVLIFVYVLFLLYYRDHIRQFLLKLVPETQKQEMEKIVFNVAHVSQRYLLGLAKMIVCLWIMYGIGFSIVGVQNAIFFAILCGLLEIVPFVGNIVGTIITVLVAAAQGAGTPMLLGIIGTYGLVQFIQGWVLEPVIVGPHVKINPLFTIIALVVGELLWGLPGIFLAIPVIGMLKIVCDHFPKLKPYGFLIGEVGSSKSDSLLSRRIKKWLTRK